MQALLYFFANYRNFVIFLLLEFISFSLIVTYNRDYNSYFVSTTSSYTARFSAVSNSFWQYFQLKDVNAELLKENSYLRYLLAKEKLGKRPVLDPVRDSVVASLYKWIPANVVNNTTYMANNYITIDKGTKDGIAPGLGVITSFGLVGRVKSCSEKFSIVSSLLNSDNLISVQIKRNRVLGSLRWDRKNPRYARVLHIPSHFDVLVGDTIVTSSYNSIFPTGVYVGVVREADIKQDETFYSLEVELAVDFSRLNYVYVFRNPMLEEQMALEKDTANKEIPEKYLSDAKKRDLEKKKRESEEQKRKDRKELEEKIRRELENEQYPNRKEGDGKDSTIKQSPKEDKK